MTDARTFVIGDLHGCVDELEWLLERLAPGSADTIVFLGDYIDRGPASKAVIERMLRLRREGPKCVFLKGNHEDMFLAYMGLRGNYGDAFVGNGGEATLRSYGLDDCPAALVASRLPSDHLDFLQELKLTYEDGSFMCVHAGFAPDRGLHEQRDEDLVWIREDFLQAPHPFPFTVLFGHTPHREVFLDLPYKLGLDTGLVYWNKLSCLELRDTDLFQIRRGDRRVHKRSLRAQLRRRDLG